MLYWMSDSVRCRITRELFACQTRGREYLLSLQEAPSAKPFSSARGARCWQAPTARFVPKLFVLLASSTYVEVHPNTSGASSVNMQQIATLSARGNRRTEPVVEGLMRLINSRTKKIYKLRAPHVCALVFSGLCS